MLNQDTVQLSIHLLCTIRHDGERSEEGWSAVCPALSVASQGKTEEDAKRSLTEAIELWVESCLERGTLDQALRELDFRRSAHRAVPPGMQRVGADQAEDDSDVQEGVFPISLMIPAYQAA
jgi:predicted RNase H-like HicB family nuclease